MRKAALALLVLLIVVACTPYRGGQPDGPPNGKLLFGEEFDSFNSSVWTKGWYGSAPVNNYETACYADSQVSVTSGSLDLHGIAQTTTCGGKARPYLSGNIQSRDKMEFTPPIYIEARVWTDNVGDKIANWPAVWMDGHNWPTTGELDIMEGLGGVAESTWHGPQGQNHIATCGNTLGWHIYGVLWKKGSVTGYCDGIQSGSYSGSNVVDAPQYLIIGNQYSPENQWGGPVKADSHLLVDWIRVWTPE